VRLFLDTSVLLAACGSQHGASREIFRCAPDCEWTLLASPYVIEEVLANLSNLPNTAAVDWKQLRSSLVLMDDTHFAHSISRAFDNAEATSPAGTDTIPRPTSNTKKVKILPPTVTG